MKNRIIWAVTYKVSCWIAHGMPILVDPSMTQGFFGKIVFL